MIPDSTIFAGQYVDKNGAPIYDLYNHAKDIHHKNYEYFSIDLKGQDKVWNGTELVDATTIGVWETDQYGNRAFYPYMPGTTKKIHKVVAELNQFCGAYDNNWSDDNWKYTVSNNGQNTDYARIDYMTTALQAGKLPKNDKEWVVVGNCADGYYSDWIVSFLPAEPEETPPTPSTVIEKLRVIAEDLSVGENTDFDFNDVVFDVIWTKVYSDETHTTLTSQTVEITLQAAGGTLPLYVDGKEVHHEFGVDQHTMVNTNAKARGMNGKDDATPVTWTTTNYSGTTIGEIANSIEVKVIKNGEEILLSAVRGRIASKIGVKIEPTPYVWCYEREDIDHRYSLSDGTSLFTEWVQGIYPASDWYTYAKKSIDDYRAAKAALNAQGNQQP